MFLPLKLNQRIVRNDCIPKTLLLKEKTNFFTTLLNIFLFLSNLPIVSRETFDFNDKIVNDVLFSFAIKDKLILKLKQKAVFVKSILEFKHWTSSEYFLVCNS